MVFKKRSTAIIIVVLTAIVFSLLGARLSINRAVRKVENMFFTGVENETSIQTYLDNAFKEAKTVYSAASQYLGDTADGFRSAYNSLYDAKTIGEKYHCNIALQRELELLVQAMDGAEMSEKEREYFNDHVSAMKNIQRMIESSTYNDEVAELEKVLDTFPANILRVIVFSDSPEYFGAEG